jgi:hypothetical protein
VLEEKEQEQDDLGKVVVLVIGILTRSSREDNQARPVVLNQLSHLRKLHSFVLKERIRAVNRARGRVRKEERKKKRSDYRSLG